MGKIFNKGLDEEENKKEGLFKRLKILKQIKTKIIMIVIGDRSNPSSARSEPSKKTLTSDDEALTSFEYLKDNTEKFF